MKRRAEGKVALVTGAGRGQGRSHAVLLAQEGANIIAVDICRDIESNPYPLSRPEDLAETGRLVAEAGGGVVTRVVDVRERAELHDAVEAGIAEFGRIDVVVANAGIDPMSLTVRDPMYFVDAVDVDLIGVMNTVAATMPHLGEWASIILTGSNAGLMRGAANNPVLGPGGAGYSWAKRTLVSYTEQLALHLAPKMIRANAIHPTNVNTHLLHNEIIYKLFRPDLDQPTRAEAEVAFVDFQAMPIPYVEPLDISNLVLFLASDESRYVTGQQIRVDAGSLLKYPNGPGG